MKVKKINTNLTVFATEGANHSDTSNVEAESKEDFAEIILQKRFKFKISAKS